MENIQKDYKLLFDLYDVNKENSISQENLVLILELLGLSGEFIILPIEDELTKITFEKYVNILENLTISIDLRNKKILFDEYSDDNGYISRRILGLMLENHLDFMSVDDRTNLIDDYMNGEEKINFERFKLINIF